MKILLWFIAIVASILFAECKQQVVSTRESASFEGNRVYRVYAAKDKVESVQELIAQFNVDIWSEMKSSDNGKSFKSDIHVGASDIFSFEAVLKNNRVSWEILIADVDALVSESLSPASLANEASYSREYLKMDVSDDPFFKSYQKMDSILSFVETIAHEFPEMVSIVSAGKTYEGREITGLRFNKLTTTSGRNKIVYHGGQHSREWIGVATMCYFIRQFATLYGKDEGITRMLEQFDITIFPVMNIDGYIYTYEKNRMWRKNRQPNDGSRCSGTDPNRNWGKAWGTAGSSKDPCSDAFHGSGPFSAPETKAMSEYLTKLNDEGGVISYIDFHAYSQLWMFPYGYSCTSPASDAAKLAEAGTEATKVLKSFYGTRYKVGSICNIIYQASGSSVDWAYSEGITFTYGVELRDTGRYGFLLPPTQILPSGKETLEGVKVLNEYILSHQ